MKKNLIHGMMALLFVLIVCISSTAAADDTVTRDLPDSASAGTTITVNLTVDVGTSATFYNIDETVPSGWTVTSATDGGDYTADPGHVKWVVVGVAANKVYSYTVKVPTAASGVYTFDGIYNFEGMGGEASILGDTAMTIIAAADDTVTRDLPDSASAGATITVSLTVDVGTSATYYSIDEIVPSGWTVTSATDGGDYTAETGHVTWVVIGGVADKVYSYTVEVPVAASGAYTFSGDYEFEGMTDTATILGDTAMNVESGAAAGDTVTRDLPDSASAGATVTVSLTVDVGTSATYYSIDEIVPSGWTVTSATDGGDYAAEAGHVKWVILGSVVDKVYSYTVEVPASASGAHTFSGIYNFEGMEDEASILGDTAMTVEAPVLTTITVDPATLSIGAGNTQAFTATTLDQNGAAITATIAWSSSNTTVGLINASTGMFTAVAAGATTVTATSGSVTGNTSVTVMSPSVLTTIVVSPTTTNLTVSDTQVFMAKAYDQFGSAMPDIVITWTSMDTDLGTVDPTSAKTGAEGNATTTFTAVDVGTTTVMAANETVNGTAAVAVYDSADTNHNCVVSMMELMTQIVKWKSGSVGTMEMMASISRWKLGTGGYC